MSFGFSFGDFLALGSLAYKLYDQCKTSKAEFQSISGDVISLHKVVKAIEGSWEKLQKCSDSRALDQLKELSSLSAECKAVLGDLEKLLNQHRTNPRKPRHTRFISRINQVRVVKDIGAIRDRLMTRTQMLATLNTTIVILSVKGIVINAPKRALSHTKLGARSQTTDQAKVLEVLNKIYVESQNGHRDAPAFSQVTARNLHPDNVWQDVTNQMAREGISSTTIRANRNFIQDWIDKVIMDDDGDDKGSECASIDSSEERVYPQTISEAYQDPSMPQVGKADPGIPPAREDANKSPDIAVPIPDTASEPKEEIIVRTEIEEAISMPIYAIQLPENLVRLPQTNDAEPPPPAIPRRNSSRRGNFNRNDKPKVTVTTSDKAQTCNNCAFSTSSGLSTPAGSIMKTEASIEKETLEIPPFTRLLKAIKPENESLRLPIHESLAEIKAFVNVYFHSPLKHTLNIPPAFENRYVEEKLTSLFTANNLFFDLDTIKDEIRRADKNRNGSLDQNELAYLFLSLDGQLWDVEDHTLDKILQQAAKMGDTALETWFSTISECEELLVLPWGWRRDKKRDGVWTFDHGFHDYIQSRSKPHLPLRSFSAIKVIAEEVCTRSIQAADLLFDGLSATDQELYNDFKSLILALQDSVLTLMDTANVTVQGRRIDAGRFLALRIRHGVYSGAGEDVEQPL